MAREFQPNADEVPIMACRYDTPDQARVAAERYACTDCGDEVRTYEVRERDRYGTDLTRYAAYFVRKGLTIGWLEV